MSRYAADAGFEVVIGLEIHAQLATRSKIFSGASTAFGAEPNVQACAVDLGLPGVLPVFNEGALKMATLFGLAINAEIAKVSSFDRKNYFYPDLPKGYQITQLARPIVSGGQVRIQVGEGDQAYQKTINVTRAHLEEDAGKSLHENFESVTGIDLNRAGTPLIEIVSEPEMASAEEAVAYARKIHAIVQYIGICDGNMQEGSFRVDANVSVREKGQTELGTRTEIKNLNSFRFLQRAIEFEIERQIDVIESGQSVVQATRLYDPQKDETRLMRTKEEAEDYRYFPDPDLLPITLSEAQIEQWRAELPELPDAKAERYQAEYGLNRYDATVLTASRATANYFEAVLSAYPKNPKLAANWVQGSLAALLNRLEIDASQSPVKPEVLATLLERIDDGTLSNKLAREVFEVLAEDTDKTVDGIIEERGLKQITDSSEIEALVDKVIADNPGQVAAYRGGKDKLFGFFVGQVMKATGGKANPKAVNEILKSRLDS
ncbi:MAG TPA: Asp-tRNA(Asn)/Glu-tRNA(Gln) amidotransferase subunit GatB [Halothiobacillaceae bacterium]|nr:Asp-tRNA(Asn)/Glu-tRNA(Gln) amidotransferase subunit GatB [Halothiobacillaceae bacterium]